MSATTDIPTIGALVAVRGQRWVVSDISTGERSNLVSLQSVEDGRYGHTLDVIWEVEPARQVLPTGALPEVNEKAFDSPQRLTAFLDAVRWSAVTSADVKTLQAPFRSGVAIEDYQLEPVARAVDAPRVNLLLADDVGLGKTIEAGLVAQELLLRHRGRRIMIVCPAGLTIKWHDEMAEKFGLDFTIIDTERCALVRRTHGSAANPFVVYPQSIVSLPWLRGPKAQRLLDEVLPADGPTYPRTFDLLILDEAHHVAPAAPKQVYAVDSQQTKLIRRMAPHFAHRLFLSATPHNGYQASFTALLEILDNQRFARGVDPDPAAVKDTVVRRLKRDIVNLDGSPRFPERHTRAMPVQYPQSEREVHALLKEFAKLRRQRLVTQRGRRATDLVTLLLKKRLFSSPAAFAHTVGVYLETLRSRKAPAQLVDEDVPEWMEDFFDDVATLDDEELAEAEDDALGRARPMQPDANDREIQLLVAMQEWAATREAQPDAKAKELVTYLKAVCRPDGNNWLQERVVVFTEYRDTQIWLAQLLGQEGLAGDRLAQLHGAVSTEDREQLRLAFQADPTDHKVRILLATDAASEGIDLQKYCHRLVNYDIPFNPNKLEQRIGRIDRYGQRTTPDVRHFVGTGFGAAVDSFEADLEFLSRVATKVAQMKEDLGSVNAVLADAVQRAMLGETVDVDVVGTVAAPDVPVESNVGEQVRRLRTNLDETVRELGVTPSAVKRVVETALELARQQPLTPHLDDKHPIGGLYTVPPLTGSWQRAAAGLTDKLNRPGEPPRQLPVTFDAAVAKEMSEHDSTAVLAHLGHPLVAMSTRLLRAAVSNSAIGLHRVTAVISDDPALEDVLVGAYSRFVLVGADGVRLHEEVLYAGGWAPERGRFRRLENLTTLGSIMDRGLTGGVVASEPVQARLVERWPRVADGLLAAIEWRTAIRRDSLERKLAQRQQAEQDRVTSNLDQFAATLRGALAVPEEEAEDALFSREELHTLQKSREELAQFRRDREAWEERLRSLEAERDRELDIIAARYRDPKPHRFPVAVIFVVPKAEATR
ncbi:DISARM system SNF2-like helicase DrmD [Virgisporangium aurantiacum]|uniref:Helicase SNF2 family protein n=1 Tax=Virgisporangium aurantiacum TaxID=175570 RepID=A0A8J4E1L6_9ACTN|nr:DISARM system SNF2-like helicase DrmD [Virgisporangium aurantiacum]GIJ56097.1 helicase SNF2 family protein [Virgisporangium aurantiacum]